MPTTRQRTPTPISLAASTEGSGGFDSGWNLDAGRRWGVWSVRFSVINGNKVAVQLGRWFIECPSTKAFERTSQCAESCGWLAEQAGVGASEADEPTTIPDDHVIDERHV
jgi:hypothetical protein